MILGRYEFENTRFPVKMSIDKKGLLFQFTGYLNLNPKLAKNLKDSIEADVNVWVEGAARKVPCGIVPKKIYQKISALSVTVGEENVNIEGVIDVPDCAQLRQNMLRVPGGCFKMGSETWEDSKPKHQVCLKSFLLDKYEVTQREYAAFTKEVKFQFDQCGENCPAETVSWKEAFAFCDKLGKRLPTEAEWEYAALAGSGAENYWGGGSPEAHAWYVKNSKSKINVVGSKSANPMGFYDMAGNVSEWVMDWYARDSYTKEPMTNPQGSSKSEYRVVRGGHWGSEAKGLGARKRSSFEPDFRMDALGFRCADSE